MQPPLLGSDSSTGPVHLEQAPPVRHVSNRFVFFLILCSLDVSKRYKEEFCLFSLNLQFTASDPSPEPWGFPRLIYGDNVVVLSNAL